MRAAVLMCDVNPREVGEHDQMLDGDATRADSQESRLTQVRDRMSREDTVAVLLGTDQQVRHT